LCAFCSAGFEKPSAIQQKGIVPFGKGLDVIQQAQSGTGKTATFCAGILQNLDYTLMECQALVLAPTRELAQQIEKVMRALGDYLQVSLLRVVRWFGCRSWLSGFWWVAV
jgi:translation initiation factor 4A